MPGLDPGIHAFATTKEDVDGGVKPGHDVGRGPCFSTSPPRTNPTHKIYTIVTSRTVSAEHGIAIRLPNSKWNRSACHA
jgi:hypothetical protein